MHLKIVHLDQKAKTLNRRTKDLLKASCFTVIFAALFGLNLSAAMGEWTSNNGEWFCFLHAWSAGYSLTYFCSSLWQGLELLKQ